MSLPKKPEFLTSATAFSFDELSLMAYSTDASVYREKPAAVICPQSKEDIRELILWANENHVSLIPRGAGTSLAGQVVGNGIVVDCAKYLNKILEFNAKERWVVVEPGVVLDDLNRFLRPHELFFAPETSTASRCNIGGMVGNNSCGMHSLIYGSTRDHIEALTAFLSDGSEALFEPLTPSLLQEKYLLNNLEGAIYRQFRDFFSDEDFLQEIENQYPDKRIPRRNHGYALDVLAESAPFSESEKKFNVCRLLAGSEGTLAFTTSIKLRLLPLPPPCRGLLCVHVHNLMEAAQVNLVALQHHPAAVELMDKHILDLAKKNIEQTRNLFFIQGDPGAIVMVEFFGNSNDEITEKAKILIESLRKKGLGFHLPFILGSDIQRVLDLRKAGLGILSNTTGDAKPVTVVEDVAVLPEQLPKYLLEFDALMKKYGLKCAYHAHIATGELHTRPLLNLKNPDDILLFQKIAEETAFLVKKYRGSLSGEHGDGRLRSAFIPLMLGNVVYEKMRAIKNLWDPNRIFNPGKIIDSAPITNSLRFDVEKSLRNIPTVFDFSDAGGILRATEKCNGSADCRQNKAGGTLCPSFRATQNEIDSTRARANVLREVLTFSEKDNPFDSKLLHDVLDRCLMCKACKSECPSSVDVAKMKMEFLQQYQDIHGVSFRSKLIAHLPEISRWVASFSGIVNLFTSGKLANKIMGFSTKRSIIKYARKSFNRKYSKKLNPKNPKAAVYLFVDEFTKFNDSRIGFQAVRLLIKLGYEVRILKHEWSGRTWLSKGFLRKAQQIAIKNVELFSPLIDAQTPLIGIEPSTILSFRDEYPDLVGETLKPQAQKLAQNVLLFDEFLAREIDAGNIAANLFTQQQKTIALHGHCQQKAIASTETTLKMLSLPINYNVFEIPSGCCGMAGSFGYEKEHYELSMQIGEMVLFPEIRKLPENTLIAASGTSCRQQIKDGTEKTALHPIEILFEALL